MVDKCIETDDLLLWKDFYQDFDKFKEENLGDVKKHSIFTSNSGFMQQRNNQSSNEDDKQIFRDINLRNNFGVSDIDREEFLDKSRSDLTGNNLNNFNRKEVYDAKKENLRNLKRGKSKTIQNSPISMNRDKINFNVKNQKKANLKGLINPNLTTKNSNDQGIPKADKKIDASNEKCENSDDEVEGNLLPIINNALRKSQKSQKNDNEENPPVINRKKSLSVGLNSKLMRLNSKIVEDDKEDEFSKSNETLEIKGIGGLQENMANKLIKIKSCDEVGIIKPTESLNTDSESSDINILEDEINLMNNTMVQY